jgi:hypothetical protein
MDKRKAAQEALSRMKSKGRFKLPEGDTHFRVLPNAKGIDKADFVEYMMHYGIGPKHQTRRCGKSTKGIGDCWLCDVAIPKLANSKKDSLKAMAANLQPKEVAAVQIIYQEASGSWRGPVLFELPGTVAQSLIGFFARGNRQYTDPKRGYNFTIGRSGTDKRTRYGNLEPDDKPSAVPDSVIAKIKPFADIVSRYSLEDMKAAYYGQDKAAEEAAAPIESDGADEAAEEAAALEGTDEATETEEVEEVETQTEEVEEETETESAEDEFNFEDETPAPKTKKPATKQKAATVEEDIDFGEADADPEAVEEVEESSDVEEVEDIELELEEEEVEAPPAKKPVAKPVAKKPVPPPAKKLVKKVVKK